MAQSIVVLGAREHNLKNISLEIPHRKLTVITGVSGSGKSTLAFNILYAEGQRRYIESLSSYTKQFLERVARPDVDDVLGISPSIAIQQKNTTRSSRSTVGTATEIYDYLRLLFARAGKTICPDCKAEVRSYSPDEVIEDVLARCKEASLLIIAPVPVERENGEDLVSRFVSRGYSRAMVGGKLVKFAAFSGKLVDDSGRIALVLDRMAARPDRRARLFEAIEAAYRMADGVVEFVDQESSRLLRYTNRLICTSCSKSFEEPSPLLFSFNTPYGACPHCRGFGNRMEFDERLIIPDPDKSIERQAIEPWSTGRMEYFYEELIGFCRKKRISTKVPFRKLDPEEKRMLLEGDDSFVGVIPFLEEMREKTYKRYARFFTRRYLSFNECRHCGGGRLRREAYNVQLGGKDIRDVSMMTPGAALAFVKGLSFGAAEKTIVRDVMLELKSRLQFLLDVGLHYLTLNRLTRTLSGGEAQRISLANSLGANLVDILYVLDEPSIGLHPRDTGRLVNVLFALKKRGNTVVVVEHDLEIIRNSDYLIDLGPGAGERGGEVLYQGPLARARSKRSKTLKYVRKGLPPLKARKKTGTFEQWIGLEGVTEHNLKSIDVSFPVGAFTVVTGVSGSGKSTLVCDVLYNALKTSRVPGYRASFSRITGGEFVSDVLLVDQSPIGKTARSNPITYIKAFSFIRDIFATTRLSVKRGYSSGRFSFNIPGGRCNRCQGLGYEQVEMHFMADMEVPCPDCNGKRFNPETLEVTFKGKNLSEVLDTTVDEAISLFSGFKPLTRRLDVLKKVGLGYLRLGQPSNTLSGGESQRLKIARELSEGRSEKVLYIMDEPTTGLHIEDVDVLLGVLGELVEAGHTVVVIEHNPQIILQADYVIDLGPEGGDEGGYVVATGSPREIARSKMSHTGTFLKKFIRESRRGKS